MTTEKLKTTIEAIEKLPDDFAWLINCPDCEGDKYTPGHGCNGTPYDCSSICPVPVQCERCQASGNAPLFTKAELTELATAASRCLDFEAMVEKAEKIVFENGDFIEPFYDYDAHYWCHGRKGFTEVGPFNSILDAYTALTATTEEKV